MLATPSTPPRNGRPAGRAASRAAGTLGCLALAASAVAAVGLSSTDRVLESSFSAALAGQASGRQTATAPWGAHTASVSTSMSGSEDYWLGRLPSGARTVAWSSPLAVGDRFAMGAEGAERHLAVVSIRETSVSLGGDNGGQSARLLMVECRDAALGPGSPTVRLIMDDTLAASIKAGVTLARTL